MINAPDATARVGDPLFLDAAARDFPPHPLTPKEPLIRLRVNYTGGYQTTHPNRFGQRFIKRVANTHDLVVFQRKAAAGAAQKPGRLSAAERRDLLDTAWVSTPSSNRARRNRA